MISRDEIKVLDKNSEYYGLPAITLMENAGRKVAEFAIQKIREKNKNIIVFCGLGNNGGDGFVSARYLSKEFNVSVFLTGLERNIKTDIAKKNFKKLKKEKSTKIYYIDSLDRLDELLENNSIIIDSMLGIGLSGTLREPYSILVKKINSLKNKTTISVDVPTGFGTNMSIKPDYTVTFHDLKEGMNRKNSGVIEIADIGILRKAVEYVGCGELSVYYPKPDKYSHKGDNGKVLIIGGGPYIGAPALAGFAALRTGSDLVYIATPRRVAKAITSFSPVFFKPKKLARDIAKLSPNLIVRELNDETNLSLKDVPIIKDFVSKVDAVVIGPGLGIKDETKNVIKKTIISCRRQKKLLVVDADAIQVVGENLQIIKNSKTVVTPHAGEFRKLTGVTLPEEVDKRKKIVSEWAGKLKVTILLKGQLDIISNGFQTKLNDVHNPAMTVGGTGDVLSGITGALLSKNIEPFNAARIAAFINGDAGNKAFKKYSYGLVATDVIDQIPNVIKQYVG